jgi:hypothetical protein
MTCSLRQLRIPIIALILTLAAVFCFSCKKTGSVTIVRKYPVCLNGGRIDSVHYSCICPVGYEDSICEIVSRDKFCGNWTVLEKGSIGGQAQYPINIVPGTAITDVAIRNFNNYFQTTIKATIIHDTLYIPNQHYEMKTVFGYGYIYTSNSYMQYGSINMRYEVIDSITNSVDDFGWYLPDGSSPSLWNK